MSFSTVVATAFKALALSIFFTLLGTIGLNPNAWGSDQYRFNSCKAAVVGENLEIANRKDGAAFIVFRDFDHAIKYLKDKHAETKKNPSTRAHILLPVMNGVLQLVREENSKNKRSKSDFSSRKRLDLIWSISMWFNTLQQVDKIGDFLDERDLDDLYQAAIRLTGSFLYSDLESSQNSSMFASIYANLKRPPPQKQLSNWLRSYKKAIATANYNDLGKILKILYLIDLPDFKRVQMSNSWLKREVKVRAEAAVLPLSTLGHNLVRLYELNPESALQYYSRNRDDFFELNFSRPELIVRPLLYFKYVLNVDDIEIKQGVLARHFSADRRKKTSGIEKEGADLLHELGVTFEQNIFDWAASSIEMDLFVELEEGRKVNFELDGPHHFIVDEDGNYLLNEEGRRVRLLADTRRDEILRSLGVEVYRIPYNGFNRDELEATKEKLIEYLIDGKQ